METPEHHPSFPMKKRPEETPPLVLASGSSIRADMLRNAGLDVIVDPASVDEDEFKRALRADGAPVADVAETLAEVKAKRVSTRHPGALVLGADQMLECGDIWFDKPVDRDHAAGHLRALSGKTHKLITAAVIVQNDTRLWHTIDSAALTVRPLSDAVIAAYLDRVGDRALSSVGAYQLEAEGAHLFTQISGDYFTILGLPLLQILHYLRGRGHLI